MPTETPVAPPQKTVPPNTEDRVADIGLIGLAVMGENLILNMESRGYTVAVFNRTTQKVTDFIEGRGKGKHLVGSLGLPEFVHALKTPRKIMIMVQAGKPVDMVIEQLEPLLEKGDVIIDGGNSNYADTTRRTKALKAKGLHFVGAGVSGGEEGALKGPSIMPGGDESAWPIIKDIFQSIAAKVPAEPTKTEGTKHDDGPNMVPCCDWVGDEGAGHYVKMVHNGIEYGDIQLICEAYHLLSHILKYDAAKLSEVFKKWNTGVLDSYLVEITGDILGTTDPETGKPMVDMIQDTAGQKGTGKWTVISALDLGVPLTLISEAVFARTLSSQKEERVAASKILAGPKDAKYSGDEQKLVDAVEMALYGAKIVSYAQGFALMRAMAKESGWTINNGAVALMWRGGCIIRSAFLGEIKKAFDRNGDLPNLLVDEYFAAEMEKAQAGWRTAVAAGVAAGIPMPAMTAALSYFDGYRTARLPANLLQAQRDYFGAHTYERTDKPRGQFFHMNWTGHGGTTSSSTYNA